MSVKHFKVEDTCAKDAITLNVTALRETVTLSIYERYGGDDEGPIRASITISRAMWERIKATIDQREDAK